MPPLRTTADTPATGETLFAPPLGPNDMGKSDTFKKRRGPVSCAECRRLKLKCDRRLPCSTCSKRGCAAICPNGTLAAGPGKRFVLADTEQLHEKISQMGKRIVELEDALADVQAQISDDPHPLLSDEHLFLKAPISTANVTSSMKAASEDGASLGKLTLGDRGNFVGPTADADYLLETSAPDTAGSSCALPLEILLMANTFPFTSVLGMQQHVMQRLADFLPPAPVARELSDLYYARATWLFELIPREEFFETIFSVVYMGESPSAEGIAPHDLGLMFMIFACACMTNLNRPPYNPEASSYYQLARVSIGIDSVIDHPTLQAVRAIHMMSTFVQMCDHPHGATTCYALLGLNAQLCQALGLHRVDTQWSLSESERDKRRTVFWNVVGLDACISLSLGRPPCFSAAHIDAKLPEVAEGPTSREGHEEQIFRAWWFRFARDCLLKVMDEAFGVAPLTYATVLRLDRLVREHRLGESSQSTTDATKQGSSERLTLQRAAAFTMTQRLLLHLHRSFFVQAFMDFPADPLKSMYAQSVLAAFRCALYITSSVCTLYSRSPLSVRFHIFWSHAFSASWILGGILIRSPWCGLAPAAWIELDRVYKLFEELASRSRRIASTLPELRRLHKFAQDAYQGFTSSKSTFSPSGPENHAWSHHVLDGELKHFFGFTRVIDDTRATSPSSSSNSHSSPTSTPISSSSSGSAPVIPFNATPSLTTPVSRPPSQMDFYDFLATPFPLGPPETGLQQPQTLPSQVLPPQDWPFADWMASSAPIHMDTPFLPFANTTMGGADRRSGVASTLYDAPAPAPHWALPPLWAGRAADPFNTPSPETGEGLLDGRDLDETWMRFTDRVGFDDPPLCL